jgi:hypothetical protein
VGDLTDIFEIIDDLLKDKESLNEIFKKITGNGI